MLFKYHSTNGILVSVLVHLIFKNDSSHFQQTVFSSYFCVTAKEVMTLKVVLMNAFK